ncbi:hypothetical protein BN970_05059 [Mycolicibacterium conceptionense]|uniref:Uncharacterized protein n=1 Tax=Mycolicibacterium conceptionense TaxID=451644 RepID=A0A0U1DRR0_9MYCO|nr:hypothetical protein [Mycolicibacterium conceptionense]ORV29059.1 hypothetical protein AWB98_06625 [Mycolicibacterium conceptionense]CQD21587.1 hypothetical protein BN970_05059 [Mycolicibacterium conceptionense]
MGAGDLVGVVGGVVGAVAGLVALIYAHKANTKSDSSNDLARTANDLASTANTLATEANTTADNALEVAKEANQYSHRDEARATERHDVHWDEGWESLQRGIYCLTKRGDDEAHDVKATVTFAGQELTRRASLITDDKTSLSFEFGSAAYDAAQQAYNDSLRRGSMSASVAVRTVQVHVDWTTRLDAPKHYENSSPIVLVGPATGRR